MKRCEYCGKEISYHQMYCDDKCQENAIKFYDMRDKISTIMGVLNGICVMSIGVGLFIFSLHKLIGAYMISIPLLILGFLFFLYPIPADVMINKNKIEKSVKTTRIIALILLVLGIVALSLTIFTL